jgi:predicted acylesterase/phospholipase RssA
MGLTIVHKSDLTARKRNPRVALVLAGGAVTGGAYKLGGLKALDDFLVNRKTTDFDIYVGLSAGAMLAAPLAASVTPAEMLRSIEGVSEEFSALRASDFYGLNFGEFARKPVDFLFDLVTYVPGLLYDFLVQTPTVLRLLEEPLTRARHQATLDNLLECVTPIVDAIGSAREFPFPLAYMPSGLFSNAPLERYLRRNMERQGMPNDFRDLYKTRGTELYVVAMKLDTAERAVFGHDEDNSLTISEAVQASTALPGFYKPARLRGIDYVDGGVRRTANIDVAIEHGADLIICYNPFRPFSNPVHQRYIPEEGRYEITGRPLADQGMFAILNQVFRTLLHSRLQLGIRQYQEDPHFGGDIILVEPADTDHAFFRMAPLNFWAARHAGAHGYLSVTETVESHYELMRQILQSYGIQMTRREVREGLERLLVHTGDAQDGVLMRDVPKRDLHVA